jgi:hypothetical protein
MTSPSARSRREPLRSQPQVMGSLMCVETGRDDPGSRPGLQANSSTLLCCLLSHQLREHHEEMAQARPTAVEKSRDSDTLTRLLPSASHQRSRSAYPNTDRARRSRRAITSTSHCAISSGSVSQRPTSPRSNGEMGPAHVQVHGDMHDGPLPWLAVASGCPC